MQKQVVGLLVVVFLVNSILFAGGGRDAAGAANKPVTLTVLWFDDANESKVFLDTMKDYLDANPHIKLEMEIVAFSEFDQKLRMLITGGNPPDIARVTTNSAVRFVDDLLPLEQYIPEINELKKNYLPASLEYAVNSRGQMVAFPTEATANGMLVNKTAFRKAGIDVDAVSKTWTWPVWEETVKKVIAANSGMKYGLALDFTAHRFSTILFQFGGHFLNANQTAMNFSNPENLETIRFIKRLHDSELMPRSVWMGSENPAELFQAGIVACHIGGSWNINAYNQNIKNFEWGAVKMPTAKTASSVVGGKFIASFKGAAYPAEAAAFMKVFSDREHTARYARDTFNISARMDTQINYPSNTGDFQVFSDELKVTPAFTANEWKTQAVNNISIFIREQVVEVLLGKISPETAAKNIDEKGSASF